MPIPDEVRFMTVESMTYFKNRLPANGKAVRHIST